LTCPSREQLSSYLLQVLDDDVRAYVAFHLETVGCPYCLANLHDLESLQREPAREVEARRRRIYASSVDLVQGRRDGPRR
jgi:hypothetical protein